MNLVDFTVSNLNGENIAKEGEKLKIFRQNLSFYSVEPKEIHL
jgi:hypothetical protein